MLIDSIKSDLEAAVREKNEVKKLVLRSLLSAVNYYRIEVQRELTDEDVRKVVVREVKKHLESIELFSQGDRPELAEKERKEMEILQAYLPKQMDKTKTERVVKAKSEELKAKNELNLGNLMKAAMRELSGKADGKVVKEIVDRILKK